MKRPTKKDALAYFQSRENWVPVWEDKSVHLRLDRLKHTKCFELTMIDFHSDRLDGPLECSIAYSLYNKDEKALNGYLDGQPNQAAIRSAVVDTWSEDD